MHDNHDRREKELTVTETAERLGADTSTVRRWIDAGYFPNAHRLSPTPKSEYRIPLSDIVAFEKNRKVN